MAVGTGFGQLFRGMGNDSFKRDVKQDSSLTRTLGQVGGVAISSALFQSILNVELHKRIHRPDAEEVSCPCLVPPCLAFLAAYSFMPDADENCRSSARSGTPRRSSRSSRPTCSAPRATRTRSVFARSSSWPLSPLCSHTSSASRYVTVFLSLSFPAE